MSAQSRSDLNAQIYEEACAWFIDMRSGDVDAAGRARFDAWARKSPEHLKAYLEVSEIWDDAAQVDLERRLTRETLVNRARSSRYDIVPLGAPVRGEDTPAAVDRPSRARQRDFSIFSRRARIGPSEGIAAAASELLGEKNKNNWFWRARGGLSAAAALASVAVALGAWQWWHGGAYVTGVGEQRTVTLADGSRLEMNSRTRLRVRFTAKERSIDLFDGQAFFKVAKSAERPFIVRTTNASVRAVGTEFDVYRKEDGTVVTVVEGKVAVLTPMSEANARAGPAAVQVASRSRSSPQPERTVAAAGSAEEREHQAVSYLSAGEQLTVTAQSVVQPVHADVTAATAWTHGSLIFSASRLADVVEEFNRYNERRLIIRDQQLAGMRISGVYSSTDPALLVRFLREQPGVMVDDRSSSIVISAK